MKYQRIFVPVDGSRVSTRGLAEAIGLARQTHAKVRLLHVIDAMAWSTSFGAGPGTAALIDTLRASGARILRKAHAAAGRLGVEADTLLIEAFTLRVADVILKAARKWHADLIVMGTHGRRGLDRMLLGSDADRVIRRSRVPVLLVPPAPRRK